MKTITIINKLVKWSGGEFMSHKLIDNDGTYKDLRFTKDLNDYLGESPLKVESGKFTITCGDKDLWLCKKDFKTKQELKYPRYYLNDIKEYNKVD